MSHFSIYSTSKPTNEEIVLTFTPDTDIVMYTYRIYNNGVLIDVQKVEGNTPSFIKLVDDGNLQIIVKAKDSFGKEIEYESGTYQIDTVPPTLSVGPSSLSLFVGDTLDVMSGVKAYDEVDGDISSSITSNIDEIDLKEESRQNLIYTVSDRAGNITTKTVTLNIAKKDTLGLVAFQSVIILALVAIIIVIFKYQRTLKIEKRYGKYSIEPLVDKSLSLVESIALLYKRIVSWLTSKIKKSVVLKDYAKRLDKYLLFTKDTYENSMDIISSKIIMAFIFVIIAVISKTLQYQSLNFYTLIIPFILGFFALDVVYSLEYRFYRDKMENDLLQAIIIMNNAFKSGRSIVQAVELVGNEMTGVIGDQFKKMRKELATGLNIEEVFRRFAKRIDFEEVTYLTASLAILNKTGGNIIKVFSSIERSLFLKKKLKLELKSLTGSSKIIMWVLFCVPVLFVAVISVLSPGYFNPFFESTIGFILFIIMLVLYVIYIVVVKNILKVRM